MTEGIKPTSGGAQAASERTAGSAHDDLNTLYQDHFREILAFAVKKVGNGPPDPEDVAQQTFAKYAQQRAPQDIENKRAWLYRTAGNMILTFRRDAAVVRKHAELQSHLHEIFGESDGLGPERVLLDREHVSQVVAIIRRMPRRRRRLLLLNRIEGLSYAALARRYKVSETTIRRQIAAAMKELAAYAPGFDPDEENSE